MSDPVDDPSADQPRHDAVGRRPFLFGLAALGVLAACGGDDDAKPAATSVGASTPSSTSTPVDSAPASSVAGLTRTIEGIDGPIEVPSNPQRIVALYGDSDLDALLALGVAPVAIGNFAAQEAGPGAPLEVVPWLADQPGIKGAVMIPVQPEINLEVLAAQRADLIVYNSTEAPPVDVPTVLMNLDNGFDGSLRVVARALGREDEAERLIAEYEQRLADVAGRIDTSKLVSLAYAYDFEVLGVYNAYPRDMIQGANMIEQVGLQRPVQQRDFGENQFTEATMETLGLLDGDVMLLIYGDDAQATSALEQLNTSPLWRAIPAVQRGDVIPVGIHWERRGSILAANAVLDDIERLFPAR